MATGVENFRSALHGFHRADVVQFIQTLTTQHEKELRLLREENARLQEALTAAQAEAEAATAAEAEAKIAAEEAETLKEALEAELAEAKAAAQPEVLLDRPMAPANGTPAADFNEMELAAYRRAEMTERLSRERAAASAEQMRSIFSQATEKLELTSQDLDTLLDAFRDDFEKLRQLLGDTRETVSESSASLRAASDVCGEL